jgi:hypothetical protein
MAPDFQQQELQSYHAGDAGEMAPSLVGFNLAKTGKPLQTGQPV